MTSTHEPSKKPPATKTFSLPMLTAMVVGSMIGSGIFMLPRRFGEATGGFGALIAWAVAGTGMYMLARVFQSLAVRKPELDAGVYAYAKAGFGNYMGFASALGYWAGSFIGNVSYFILIMSTVGLIKGIILERWHIPVADPYTVTQRTDWFGAGDTLVAVLVSSVILWSVHFFILRGVKQAAFINTIVTVAKIVPIVVFVAIVVFAIRKGVFMENFWGGEGETRSLWRQVAATMGVTLFVFLGVEGASVYSRYARKRQDVGTATVLGFIGVTGLMILITMLPYAVLPKPEIAGLRQPSVAGVLESVVGPWGAVFIGVGLIISVLGAYLAWSLIAAEVLWSAAKTRDMPAVLARENRHGVPAAALWLTNIGTQIFLFSTLFSRNALNLMVDLTGSVNLIPYLLVALFALKLVLTRETYETDPTGGRNEARGPGSTLERRPGGSGWTGDLIRAVLATIYTAFLIYALGWKFLLLSLIVYAPGTALYIWARREQRLRVFTAVELIVFLLACTGAIVGIVMLATGRLTI